MTETSATEMLCYCEDVTTEQFRTVALANASPDWQDACKKAGIGEKCTACLLNAEFVFESSRTAGFDSRAASRTNNAKGLPLKRRIYQFVDSLSPLIQMPSRPSSMPVISGPQVFTRVSISNEYPRRIGVKPPGATIAYRIYGSSGHLVEEGEADLPAGSIFEKEIRLPSGRGDIEVGHFVSETRLKNFGVRGSLRPHFQLVGGAGSSMLHSQGVGNNRLFVHVPKQTENESSYLHLYNANPTEISLTIRLSKIFSQDALYLEQLNLPGYSARLLKIPEVSEVDAFPLLVLYGEGTGRFRPHLVIVHGDWRYISIDHVSLV